MMIEETYLHASTGLAYSLRKLAWSGPRIVDACVVRAPYGHLLLLTEDGTLFGIDRDGGTCVALSKLSLPPLPPSDAGCYFGAPAWRLHASADGAYAAIVVDKGTEGVVVQVSSGVVTMRLDGDDYHSDTVPFSACFVRFQGRNILIHRTDWNRLDATDPATGEVLTERHFATYEAGGPRPAHYLDYFHGQLRASPDGSRVIDDGWVWHPVAVMRSWSVANWLESNPWESEDGDSVMDFAMRDDWSTPACWINDKQVALAGVSDWDGDECEEKNRTAGVQIIDATQGDQLPADKWLMALSDANIRQLFCDGQRLIVAATTQTTVWHIASRSRVSALPDFCATLYDIDRACLLAVEPEGIVECFLGD